MYRNQANQKIIIYAHDTVSDVPLSGDAGNITAYLSTDAAAASATNDTNPTELDSVNMKGLYAFDVTQTESDGRLIILSPVSSTADTSIEPIIIYTIDPVGIPKNLDYNNLGFLMIDSSDHITGKTGLTVTAQRSIDGAAFASCANSVSEIANGMYKINLAAADLNGDTIILRFSSTGADDRFITIETT